MDVSAIIKRGITIKIFNRYCGSKWEVADLLSEEAEARSIRECLHQKRNYIMKGFIQINLKG